MRMEYKLNKEGLCVVAVNAFTQAGDYCDKNTGGIVNALIDINMPSTLISKRLIAQWGLRTKTINDGKNVQEHTFIGIGIIAIWGDGALGLHPYTFDADMNSYDLILGCDFLSNVNFERRGKDNVFVLSAV